MSLPHKHPGIPICIRNDCDALCSACKTNDNYRFAYGCTGPCANQAGGDAK